MTVWIATARNYYRNSSGSLNVLGVASDPNSAKLILDERHQHAKEFCDYCRTKWNPAFGGFERKVDHDGAYVEYRVAPYQLREGNI